MRHGMAFVLDETECCQLAAHFGRSRYNVRAARIRQSLRHTLHTPSVRAFTALAGAQEQANKIDRSANELRPFLIEQGSRCPKTPRFGLFIQSAIA